MNNRRLIITIASMAGLGLLAWLAFGYFGVQALFIDKTVNEQVPFASQSESEFQPSPTTKDPSSANKPQVPSTSSQLSQSPNILAKGTFQQGDSTYTIAGKATVAEINGERTLSLTDFNVTNGPDLFVYLVPASNADNTVIKSTIEKGEFINLGELKGNQGNQNYIIPKETDSMKNYTVSIWCRRFSRNFGSALLQ